MARIHRQRRLCPHVAPSGPKWKGPPQPSPSPLARAEAAARKLRPHSRGRRLVALLRVLDLRCPALLDRDRSAGLARLAAHEPLRPLDQLGPVDGVHALVEWYLARYPLPPWAAGVFVGVDPVLDRFVPVLAALGHGGDYEAIANLLPGQLNRRVFANLLLETGPPMFALRRAQVRALRGPDWLPAALVVHRHFADFTGGLRLMAWLCREARPDELGHVLDWIVATAPNLEGRRWASVCHDALEWRRPRTVVTDSRPFPASGFASELPEPFADWRLKEMRTPVELVIDSSVQHHCVATYVGYARAGTVSLWSARRGEQRVLTIEVRNAAREIVQVRGKYNRLPDAEEIAMLQGWAAVAGLCLVPRAVKR